MSKPYAILPCNGLDKCAGCITREIALNLTKNSESSIICPVLYRTIDERYNKIAQENSVLVIDGCGTRCASKLAAEKGIKISKKINITEEAKESSIGLGSDLVLGEKELQLIDLITKGLLREEEQKEAAESIIFPETYEYQIYKKDKYVFRLPDKGFYFNENDCWAYVIGNKARIGVTDFVQKSLSDILFFDSPENGAEVEQFGEVGSIESSKAVFEIVSPVSGIITAINEDLMTSPELINQNPYEIGWIAEIELSDFESDKELIHGFGAYFEIFKRKVDEFHV